MKKLLFFVIFIGATLPNAAQRTLSLDSCRALALRNNKQLNISKLRQDVARNTRKAAKTNYLPKVDVAGTYLFSSKEASILNNDQKDYLSNLGTHVATGLSEKAPAMITDMVQNGIISMQQANTLSQMLGASAPTIANTLNNYGEQLKDAFRTDNRNIFAATVSVRQPIYMGGAITAANKMAEISEQLAYNNIETQKQATIHAIDQAYWLVVSLKQKDALANQYLQLTQQFSDDVKKMIREGVCTKADGLRVDVRVNEAEMAKTQVEDGLVLAKMYLCQLCGIAMDEEITLEDEGKETLGATTLTSTVDKELALINRPELKMLQNTIDLSKQGTKLIRAAYLPEVAVLGGYTISNPNVFNGFEHKFGGFFHVGLMVRIPVWSWNEGRYKIRASKVATNIAEMELNEAREKIDLQVSQSIFKVKEANKRLAMSTKNLEQAEENLRCANLGFHEGVMQITEVVAAQTAWQQAQSQKIDAEIEVKLCQVDLQKALGTLGTN